MTMIRLHPASFVVLAMVSLAAQERTPCTGIVRTADGSPLAGAEVTFAFAPSIDAPGEPERVTARTDSAGRFAADLVAGNAYVTWAIGPAGDGGVRLCSAPAAIAAAGRSIELAALDPIPTLRVQVRGTAPWIADGPLALRVLVAGPIACGRDVPLPGDGPIPLPPVPIAEPVLALIDGRGRIVDVRATAGSAAPSVEFATPREFAVLVEDQDGKPLPGARILHRRGLAGPVYMDPLQRHGFGVAQPLLGTTDDDGRATVRVAIDDRSGTLLAECDGHAPAMGGWSGGRRLWVRGVEPDEEEPLRFVLEARDPVRARIEGLTAGGRAAGWSRRGLSFQFRSGSGMLSLDAADGEIREGAWIGAPAPRTTYLRLHVPARVGERVLASCYGEGAELPPIDLAALAEWRITVVDAEGRLAAGAQVGVTSIGPGTPIYWSDRVALSDEGRVTLRTALREFVVYASTGASHGAAVVEADAQPGDLRLVLASLPVAALRVVDEEGAPVAGATLECTGGSYHSPSKDPVAKELDRIGFYLGQGLFAGARSDAAGLLRVPYAARDGGSYRVRVRAGERRSDPITLTVGDTPTTVTVR